MEKFTQGLWQRGAGATVITQPKAIEDDFKTWIWEYWPICDASIGQKSREEKEANAALIAAAPEMYEFIRWLRSLNGQCAILNKKNLPEIMDRAAEILRKARGEI